VDRLERKKRVCRFINARSIPWQAMGDFYTVCGEEIAAKKAREKSTYNVTFRRSPYKAWPGLVIDDRMVFYGLTDFVRECLPPEIDHLDRGGTDSVADFMLNRHAAGGQLGFDQTIWGRAAEEFGGNLPIKIEALADGRTFYPNEPVIQVTSLGHGFGEFAALVEATLLGMVSCATARATVTRHLYERMLREVRKNYISYDARQLDLVARSMVHDFGMRASSTPLESAIFGRAHLLSFTGTDTTNAAYSAWVNSESDLDGVGTSILAHAHRIILGHDTEEDAVRLLADAAERCNFPVASYLCDTYNTKVFVERFAIPLALEYKRRGRGVVVVRPDSGCYLDNIEYLVGQAHQHGLFALDHNKKAIATHFRFLLGDSMNPRRIEGTFQKLYDLNCNTVGWNIFGIGGWLRSQGNRDLLSAAYKLSAKGINDEPVVKLSEVRDKESVPGPNRLMRGDRSGPTTFMANGSQSAYTTYYDGSARDGFEAIGEGCLEGFDEVLAGSLADWDQSPPRLKQTFAPEVEAIREAVRIRHCRG
jgi:nicotinic acid phosphoribosyltransferase